MDVFLVLSAFFDSAFRPVYPIFSLGFLFCLAAGLEPVVPDTSHGYGQ